MDGKRPFFRIISALAAAVVLAAAVGCTGQAVPQPPLSAADAVSEQTVSQSDDGQKWDDIFDFAVGENGCTVTAYKGEGGDVELPAEYNGVPVTAIGDGAFINSNRLTSLTIPEGVTTIGDSVFYSCDRLERVSIPSTVSVIGKSAFTKCVSLKEVQLPEGMTAISIGTFYGCTALESVNIPSTVTSIGISAFNYCDSIGTLVIPESVTSIGFRAFWECTITVVAPHEADYYGYAVDRHVTWETA